MNNVLKIGLLGLGNMGQNHLRVLSMLKGVQLEFIYDLDREKAISLAKQYSVKSTDDLERDMQGVDAVVIATPTHTHYEYALLASKYMKRMFIEKPITDSLKKAIELQNIFEEKDITVQVGYIERFNPAVIEMKKILGRSKKVVNVEFTRTNKLSSRITDVDVILDLMIHDIDLALYMNGDVKDVFAYGALENNMIVFACAILTHQNGRFSRITASRITEKRIRTIYATCEDMFVDCNLLKKEIYINKQSVTQAYDEFKLMSVEETVDVSKQEALLSELMVFITGSLNGKNIDLDHIPDMRSAIKSMEIASEIQKRIRSSANEA